MAKTVSFRPGKSASPAGRPPALSARRRATMLRQRAAMFARRHHLAPYVLVIPSLLAIGILVIWPTIPIFEFSFQNYGLAQLVGTVPKQWIGLSNYSQILHDPEFWLSPRLSLIFAAVAVPLTLITGTLVGLLLNRLGRRMSTFVAGTAMLAWATPAVTASVVFVWLANPDGGVVDWTLSKLPHWLDGGAHWNGYSWTNAPLPAYTLIVLLVLWQSFPFVAVTVLAGLKTVPSELHESARVDGAGPWRVFWRVTYPLMRPIFQVLFLLSVIWDFGVFTQVFIIIGELGQRDEYNLGIYEDATAFTVPPAYGLASALAFILTIILLVITVGYVRASVREGALQ